MKIRICSFVVFLFFTLIDVGAQRKISTVDSSIPDNWVVSDDMFQQVLPVNDKWWTLFEDARLDSLIDLAIKQNPNAMMAINRIDMARANMRSSIGAFFPSFTLSGGWTRQQSSGLISGSGLASRSSYYNGTINMQWQVDIFGSLREKYKAQKAGYNISREDYNATMISLCAEVATAYFNLLTMQQELNVLQKNAISQKAVVNITEVRFNTGLASKLDVAQAKSVYYSTLSSIPSVEANVLHYKNSLAILLGLYPEDLENKFNELSPLPNYIFPVGVGVPASMILRRPDVRVAQFQVNQQAALLGVAKAEWFPTFYINGTFGYSSHDFKDMTKKDGMVWSIAPSMSWTIFNGGQRLNNVKAQRAQLDETINSFNNTVLTAVQEVDNAMDSYKSAIQQIAACQEMVAYGQEALKLSIDLYKQGLAQFQNVLDSQRSVLSYENSLVQAKGQSLISLVQMYQALGGGWNYVDSKNK